MSLYLKMAQQSEQELLAAIKTDPLSEAGQYATTLMLERFKKLIASVAHRYGTSTIPYEDRFTVCQMAFCGSLETVDLSKGKISTHAVWTMRTALGELRRELYPWMNQAIDQPPIHADYALVQEAELEEFSPSTIIGGDEQAERNEQETIIWENLKGLADRDIKIFCHLHGILGYEEMTLQDLAERFNVSFQRIDQITKRALGLLTQRVTDSYDKREVI